MGPYVGRARYYVARPRWPQQVGCTRTVREMMETVQMPSTTHSGGQGAKRGRKAAIVPTGLAGEKNTSQPNSSGPCRWEAFCLLVPPWRVEQGETNILSGKCRPVRERLAFCASERNRPGRNVHMPALLPVKPFCSAKWRNRWRTPPGHAAAMG